MFKTLLVDTNQRMSQALRNIDSDMKPFIRKKKIKGHEYLYEITPYFDEISGKWKQKTKYLGRNIEGATVRNDTSTEDRGGV